MATNFLVNIRAYSRETDDVILLITLYIQSNIISLFLTVIVFAKEFLFEVFVVFAVILWRLSPRVSACVFVRGGTGGARFLRR